MSKDATKKSQAINAPPVNFIRLARVRVKDSRYPAYQIERVEIAGNRIVSREFMGHPDVLEMILAKSTEALDPESVMYLDPIDVANA